MSVSISRTEIKYIRNRSCSSGGMEACRADGSRVSLKACNYSPTPRNTELTNNANYCNYADASRAEAAFKTNSTANFHNNNSSLDYCLQQKKSRCKNLLQRCNITLSLILDQSWLWNEVNMFTINETETRHVKSSQVKSSQVKSSQVKSRHVTSRHVKSRHVIKSSSHAMSRHVTSRHVKSSQFTSLQVNSSQFTSNQVTSNHIKSSHQVTFIYIVLLTIKIVLKPLYSK